MGKIYLDGDPVVLVELRRNARSRRLSLRVSRLDGKVTLTLPKWTGQREALAFAREKERWIRQQLARCPVEIVPQIGGAVLFEGKEVPLVKGPGRSARLVQGTIQLPGDPARDPARLAALFKMIARQRLQVAVLKYAGGLDLPVGRISIRDTRSRWGSCTSDGNLMFSWRLVMAPPDVLNYVAAHEVSHQVEMNHSPAYWAVVDRIYPGYSAPRQWLRDHGTQLHAYRFRN